METKKPTNAQLQRRIEKAVLHIDRTKETKTIYLSDKGVRLTVDEEYAIIETNYHRHVFTNVTSNGISRPYIYTKRFVEIALENAVEDKENGYTFTQIVSSLEKKEDKSEYNIMMYIDWWMFNIFQPLYSIGESEIESFLVYEDYLHNIARNGILLSQHDESITNKRFIELVNEKVNEFTKNMQERVILEKKSDEERLKEEIEAIQEQENEQALGIQKDESKD
jgi:hypothetical protein